MSMRKGVLMERQYAGQWFITPPLFSEPSRVLVVTVSSGAYLHPPLAAQPESTVFRELVTHVAGQWDTRPSKLGNFMEIRRAS